MADVVGFVRAPDCQLPLSCRLLAPSLSNCPALTTPITPSLLCIQLIFNLETFFTLVTLDCNRCSRLLSCLFPPTHKPSLFSSLFRKAPQSMAFLHFLNSLKLLKGLLAPVFPSDNFNHFSGVNFINHILIRLIGTTWSISFLFKIDQYTWKHDA